jgi:hypothetical protein
MNIRQTLKCFKPNPWYSQTAVSTWQLYRCTLVSPTRWPRRQFPYRNAKACRHSELRLGLLQVILMHVKDHTQTHCANAAGVLSDNLVQFRVMRVTTWTRVMKNPNTGQASAPAPAQSLFSRHTACNVQTQIILTWMLYNWHYRTVHITYWYKL